MGHRPTQLNGNDLWSQLFNDRLETIKSWVGRIGKDDQITYGFLRKLENTIKSFNTTSNRKSTFNHWYCEFIEEWKVFFKKNLNPLVPEINDSSGETLNTNRTELEFAVARAVLELLVGASGLYFVIEAPDQAMIKRKSHQLQEIFEFIPTNVAFAGDLCWEYLTALKFTTNTGS